MSRPKGSKNKKTLVQVKSSSIKQHIKQLEVKRGKPRQEIQHVLKINEWLYITCDKHTFILKEVNNEYDKDGNKYPDKSLLYAHNLDQILMVTANYLTHVPGDFNEMKKLLVDIKNLISSRIPPDTEPKDLFEDCRKDDDV